MLTKKDLLDFGKQLRKEVKEEIEIAIIQILESISKVVATKDDLKELATKEELRNGLREVNDKVDEVGTDVREIKRQINDLKADTPSPQELADHGRRIKRLETAVFPS